MTAHDPAYPTPTDLGLTKRELFAAMAMQGLCARPATHRPVDIAPLSIAMADALLAELAKDGAP